ncbi:major facilitator superfamily domain-containing protein [Pelagophyceae sp. CCMP2097]|nr:major facilitator superfamily domain-containing protein [Pelagophyceae sp. CCMP2097]
MWPQLRSCARSGQPFRCGPPTASRLRCAPPHNALLHAGLVRRRRDDGESAKDDGESAKDDSLFGVVCRDSRLLAVCGSTAALLLGQGISVPIIPLLAADLGASASVVGVALSAFGLARLAANVPVGLAADKFGRKPLLVVGAGLSAAGTLATALAPEMNSFICARAVVGLGNAAYLGAAQVYLNDIAPRSKVARYLGANQAAMLFGVSLGPVVGGLAAEISLRAPFVAVAALAAVSAAHAHISLAESKPDVGEPETVAKETVAPEMATPAHAAPPHFFFGDRRLVAAGVAHASTFALRQGGRNLVLAILAANVFDYSPSHIGMLFGATALVDLAAVAPAAWLADRVPARAITVPSLLGCAVAVALCGYVSVVDAGTVAPGEWSQHDLFLASALWSLCTAARGPVLPAYAAALSPEAQRGASTALFRSCGDVGFVAAPVLLGACADAYGPREAMGALALSTAASAALFAAHGTPATRRR